MNPSFEITLDLAPVAKGNRYKICRKGRYGPLFLRDSDEAREFKNAAAWLIRERMVSGTPFDKNDKLLMTCLVRHKTYQPDLDLGCLKDAIERSGLIHNDRHIRIEHNEIEDEKGPGRIILKLERVGKLPWTPA